MDADHVKPYFIIYLFEPHIHVDLCFYTMKSLPTRAGGPFTIAFDLENHLEQWVEEMNQSSPSLPDWSNVVHEEERMWTWIHYAWGHVARGEYYDIASEFGFLRNIPQAWFARLKGSEEFSGRRLEQRGETEFIESMKLCFPGPTLPALRTTLLNLIEVHNTQRARVDLLLYPKWKTTPAAREKITRLVAEM
jgi:hypothetical protein